MLSRSKCASHVSNTPGGAGVVVETVAKEETILSGHGKASCMSLIDPPPGPWMGLPNVTSRYFKMPMSQGKRLCLVSVSRNLI